MDVKILIEYGNLLISKLREMEDEDHPLLMDLTNEQQINIAVLQLIKEGINNGIN